MKKPEKTRKPMGFFNVGFLEKTHWVQSDRTQSSPPCGPTLWFSRPDPLVFSAQPSGFLGPTLWFSRPDSLVFSARLSGFLGQTLGFPWPDTRVFLARPSGIFGRPLGFLGCSSGFSLPNPPGFLCKTLGFSVFSGVYLAVAWLQVSLTSGLLSHAGLCGRACPCIVRPVPTSPGPWFPYLLRR